MGTCHVLNCDGNANVCGLYNVTIFTFLSVERCGPEKPCVAPCT